MAVAPPIHPPLSEARAYELVLRQKILRPIVRDTEERLREAHRTFRSIRATIDAIPTATPNLRGPAADAAAAHARRLRVYHRQRLRKTMSRFFGVKVDVLGDAAIKPMIERAIEDNVALVKTIPPRYHASLRRDLQRLAGAAPFDEEALTALLSRSYGSAGYNLRRLSRDQTSKLVGRFTRVRQEQLGIRAYRWSTAKDSRVRQTHQALEGEEFLWERPPSEGHPGEAIQCRCVALALIRPGKSRAPTPPPAPKPPPPPTPARTLRADEFRNLATALRKAPAPGGEVDQLHRFWTRRQFGNQKIASVGDEAFDALPGDPLYRGFLTTADAADVLDGKLVANRGWGSGEGFIRDRKRLRTFGDDEILEIKLRRNARIVDFDVLERERRAFIRDLDDVTGLTVAEIERVREFAADTGRFAAYRGYDVIDIPGDGRVVLVNLRAAVIRRSMRKRLVGFDLGKAKRTIRRQIDKVVALDAEAKAALARLRRATGPDRQTLTDEFMAATRARSRAEKRLLAEVESARKRTRTAAEVDATLQRIIVPANGPETWRTGARQFAETVHPSLARDVQAIVVKTKRNRSFAGYNPGDLTDIGMASGADAGVVAHELGHALEFSNRGVFDEAVDLLRAKHRKGPRSRDRGRVIDVAGDFFGPSWYPGKYYERTRSPWLREVKFPKGKRVESIKATEVVSSALEYFARDRARFAQDAPEFFWWTVDKIILPTTTP